MTTYCILCHARTGSNLLVGLLAQHPAITAHNELFHESHIYRAEATISDSDTLHRRDTDPVAYLREVMAASDTPVVGFKHLLFYEKGIIEHVMSSNLHVILLKRKNVLAQHSSLRLAHQTQQWTLKHGDAPVTPQTLSWDAEAFEAYRAEYEAAYTALESQLTTRDAPTLRISYTELTQPATVRRVFSFLGTDSTITLEHNPIRKQNTTHIPTRYADADVVREYLLAHHPQWIDE